MNNQIKKKAFTLIELLMVISLIAIMMVLFLPSLSPIKTETKQLTVTKNKDSLTGAVGMKLARLRTQGLGGDILLDELMRELNTETSIANMSNPFDATKKGIGIIKGDTYDNTNKAAYIFTSSPKEETIPQGTVFTVVKPELMVAEESPYVDVNPGVITKAPIEPFDISISSMSNSNTILKNDKIYVFGNNAYGQLGVGDQLVKPAPTLFTIDPAIKPKSMIIGYQHSLAIGIDRNLYAWGNNKYGQLGTGDAVVRYVPTLIKLPNGVKPRLITVGRTHSMAIGDDGNLYTWGDSISGQLGTTVTGDKSTPTLVPLPTTIIPKSIYAGYNYSILLTESGELYVFGNNSYGQLGLEGTTARYIPTLNSLPNGVKIKSIAVGEYHSIALGEDGNIYSWGRNLTGQLGTGDTVNRYIPTIINLPNNVKPISISVGASHSSALGDDGQLYLWGSSGLGQMGTGNSVSIIVPTPLKLPNRAKPASISNGYGHILVTDTNGDIYAWGSNATGQLGTGDTTNRLIPTLVNPFDFIK